jgi:DnaJ-class molecular chaperone
MSSHESGFECDCFIPWLEGAGQHSPGCAVFYRPCSGCGGKGALTGQGHVALCATCGGSGRVKE